MRIFLSYSSQDREIAESIHAALEAAGHDVFFDRDSLPAGESFNVRILEALDQSDLLIFLLSPSATEAGAYTLTELEFARRRWRNPAGKVLPVVIREFDLHDLPVYLRHLTLLEPEGNVPAEVVAAVYELRRRGWRLVRWAIFALVAIFVVGVIGYYTFLMKRYECRRLAADAMAFVNRMIDTANLASQREQNLLKEIKDLELDRHQASFQWHVQRSRDPKSFDFDTQAKRDWQYVMKLNNLSKQLDSVVQENNTVLTKLAQEAATHRSAVSTHCLENDHPPDSTPVPSFIDWDGPRETRFEKFLKLAKKLEALSTSVTETDIDAR